VLRERFAVAASTTSVFSLPVFQGLLFGRHRDPYNPQLLPLLLSPCGATPLPDTEQQSLLQPHIWFAVPKSKISRSRKRMKNTRQKRIPLKKNIVFDPRTGEVTLKHKMPENWKDYLPKID